jgi:hypothetical protein
MPCLGALGYHFARNAGETLKGPRPEVSDCCPLDEWEADRTWTPSGVLRRAVFVRTTRSTTQVEHLQQRDQLIDGLAVVRLIEKTPTARSGWHRSSFSGATTG